MVLLPEQFMLMLLNSIVLCEGSGVHGLVRVRLGILGGGGLGGSDGDG